MCLPKWPHNRATHGVMRPAETRPSTALGRRSMVRMGPVPQSAYVSPLQTLQ